MVEPASTPTDAAIQKQIEYYLSDANLTRDRFFREQIETDKEGWVAITHFLNCNKVKAMQLSSAQIAEACKDSEEVQVNEDKSKIRRAENKELPALNTDRKRDAKAASKGQAAANAAPEEDQVGEDGKIILVEKDFDNPLIIQFNVELGEGEEFKVKWKEVENAVRAGFPGLKLTYARGDDHGGQLAISNLRLKTELIYKLLSESMTIQEKQFKFSKLEGEPLKEFWQNQGGHYNFCIQHKLRAAKKAAKQRNVEKRESVKRAKTSYEIAGVYYLDINKVKSKSRAILNLKKDGDRLEGNDEAFVKEIISFHERTDAKMADFSHFEVGTHPQFEKTRCFFVVRNDGAKEDFSITKCIQKLEETQ